MGLGTWVQGLGFGVQGLGCGVYSSLFRVQDLEIRVDGSNGKGSIKMQQQG